MWEKFKSAMAIISITLLIWMAADQNVMEDQTFQIPVRLVPDDPQRYVAFGDAPYQVTFNVILHGRRRHLKDFSDALGSRVVFETTLDTAKLTSPQPQVMESREILARVRPLAESGLKIVSVDPVNTVVYIDDYETVPNVQVVPGYGDLKVTAVPSPQKVSVRLPRFAGKRLRADPVARADAQQQILAARQADGSFRVKIPLILDALKELDPSLPVKIIPGPEVVITGQVQSMTETQRKGPIQVTWSIPQKIQDEFRIVPDEDSVFRPDIDVTGPKDLIDQLEAREIRGFVEVLAADAEKPGTKIRRQVQFILPSGFTIAPSSPTCQITFVLQPRSPQYSSDK